MRRFALTLVLALPPLTTATVAVAQEKLPPPVVLKIHAAAAPAPSVKYLLLPEARELQAGNAAVFYQRAHSPDWFRYLERVPLFGKMHEWLEAPAQLPDKDVQQLLAFTGFFTELDRAARCETCDWQMSARLRDEGVTLMLPELNSFRQMTQLLAIKARVEMAEERPEKALRTMQAGFALGRNVGDCPLVINALVGMACTQIMLGSVEEFVQRPGAPNLYWALRDLPEPFIDLRRPLQGDRLAVDAWMPGIRKALEEPRFQSLPLHTLRATLDKMVASTKYEQRTEAATAVSLAYPKAVSYFRGLGHSQGELEALPVTQVVLMYSLAQWDSWYDAVYRWHNVPYWQARTGIKRAAEQREQMLKGNRDSFLLQNFLPANEAVFFQKARLQRRLAALQCVEAIRMYAAAHDGTLPETLEDIRNVPLPIDAVSGKPFEYSTDGTTARLFGPGPPGEIEGERQAIVYRISIARKD